ncbi:unnamed protein product [Aureobasidium pullulans]|nr:unnamed protein product [Aureobasidium pullulans]
MRFLEATRLDTAHIGRTSGQNRSVAQPPAPNVSTQDWIEPPLASPIPSFEDHGGGPYGVLEDMQALGSRPTAKVRGRVKPDGPRKNALNKSLANPMATASNQATPETTPAPMEVLPEQPLVIVDDERDDDYTPRPSKKPAKARLSRSAAINAKSTASPKPTTPSVTASETPVPSSVATPVASATPVAPPVAPPASSAPTASARHPPNPLPKDEVIRHLKAFDRVVPIPSDPDQRNLHNVVKAAVRKSMEVGNKILGLAIQDVYLESFSDPRLVHLLKGILDQTSTPAPEMVPRPSIENQAVPRKPKISLKMTKNTKAVSKPVDSPAPLPAKTKPRASSISSSSSLSSLTSIEETPEPQALMAPHYSPPPYPPRSTVAPTTLAAPVDTNGSGKRSSIEAGNDEDDRQFQAKKQKLDETVNRDAPTEESHVRPDLSAIPKLFKKKAKTKNSYVSPIFGITRSILSDSTLPRIRDYDYQNANHNFARRPRERRIHMRRPRGAKVVDTALNRDFINDGVIEIANDSSDDDSEFEEVDVSGVVYRLPEKGIKLDFIDRVRRGRAAEQYYSNPQAYSRPNKRRAMEQTDFFRRSFVEQRTALDLVGLANQQADLDFNGDQVSGLLTTLIAPADVVAQMIEAEKEAKSSDTTGPPSPPASDQHTEQSLAQQRKSLELLQTLIARKLAAMPDQ